MQSAQSFYSWAHPLKPLHDRKPPDGEIENGFAYLLLHDSFKFGKMAGGNKLDFRFADESDADELEQLIKFEYAIDQGPPYEFRKETNSNSEINVDNVPATRWVVLDAPPPGEEIMAAIRIFMGENEAKIDFVCAYGGPDERKLILDQLLAKTENVIKSHGLSKVVVEVLQWRQDRIDWLSLCGYDDFGGYLSDDPQLLKPTLVLQFQKIFNASALPLPHPSIQSIFDENVEQLSISLEGACLSTDFSHGEYEPSETMQGLMSDLFTALHKEAGEVAEHGDV